MKRFYRLCTGGPFGDETSSYDVILPEGEDITVQEFIEQILVDEPNEWGAIYNGMREVIADYKYGEATFRDGYDKYKNAKIANVTAHGGWSTMDYYIRIYQKIPKPDWSKLSEIQQLSIFDF